MRIDYDVKRNEEPFFTTQDLFAACSFLRIDNFIMAASDDYQITLPYSGNDLLGSLPTQEQIDNAEQILVKVAGCKVV